MLNTKWKGMWKSMRPHQWIKNSFVFAPLIFAQQLKNFDPLTHALMAWVAFSAISSAVYLLNDMADLQRDREHPIKKERPIAKGIVSLKEASLLSVFLVLFSLGLGWLLSPLVIGILLAYVLLNLAYSLKLKEWPFVDVAIIATGFLFRVQAGAWATGIPVSIWLNICTFLLAMYLGFGKRTHELATLTRAHTRLVLKRYQIHHLRNAMMIIGISAFGAYTIYTCVPSTQAQFGFQWPRLTLTLPLAGVGLMRFFFLTHHLDDLHSPTERMLRDPVFVINLVLWSILVLGLIYI